MSAFAQYLSAGIGLVLLGAIHGAMRRGVDALERIATAQEKGALAVEQAAKCPDYPPVR